jgi:hypothetical protein
MFTRPCHWMLRSKKVCAPIPMYVVKCRYTYICSLCRRMFNAHVFFKTEWKIASRCSISSEGWDVRNEMSFDFSGFFHLCISDRDSNLVRSYYRSRVFVLCQSDY